MISFIYSKSHPYVAQLEVFICSAVNGSTDLKAIRARSTMGVAKVFLTRASSGGGSLTPGVTRMAACEPHSEGMGTKLHGCGIPSHWVFNALDPRKTNSSREKQRSGGPDRDVGGEGKEGVCNLVPESCCGHTFSPFCITSLLL